MSTKPAIPQRFAWTIERLDIRPTDHLLEIGCGRGVAVSLICERLTTGRITAIDRSPAAITAATARNRDHIAAGKVTLEAVPLADAAFAGRFDKIFAVNVIPGGMGPYAEHARSQAAGAA